MRSVRCPLASRAVSRAVRTLSSAAIMPAARSRPAGGSSASSTLALGGGAAAIAAATTGGGVGGATVAVGPAAGVAARVPGVTATATGLPVWIGGGGGLGGAGVQAAPPTAITRVIPLAKRKARAKPENQRCAMDRVPSRESKPRQPEARCRQTPRHTTNGPARRSTIGSAAGRKPLALLPQAPSAAARLTGARGLRILRAIRQAASRHGQSRRSAGRQYPSYRRTREASRATGVLVGPPAPHTATRRAGS